MEIISKVFSMFLNEDLHLQTCLDFRFFPLKVDRKDTGIAVRVVGKSRYTELLHIAGLFSV